MLLSSRYTVAVLATGIFAGIFSLPACDQAPGPLGDGAPPALSDFVFSPHEFIAPPDAGPGDAAVVPLSMEVTARDPDQDIASVYFVVFGDTTLAEGDLVYGDGARYSGRADVAIPSGGARVYTVLVVAEDREGRLSNEVRGMMLVSTKGAPPVILAVSAPDTVYRPEAGDPATLLEIAATVSDPDGLPNISVVEFWNTVRPETRIGMRDDGTDGDAVAADGRYTRIVKVEATNDPGETVLAFQARDRAGLLSNVEEATVVVK